ncbi:hypothetical protein F2P79_023134 [Pimephales promelas]|nr:hypothetical protein F2P79_023134 [Pimephales promelas]
MASQGSSEDSKEICSANQLAASVVDLALLKGGDFEDGPDSEHQYSAFRRVTMAITQFL